MLFETASSELPLLIFTLLVPMGLAGAALVALVRGLDDGVEDAKKLDTLGILPVIVLVIGLAASFFHLGSISHVFNMANGFGTSPLSNEIVIAGASIAVAVVAWIVCMVKHPVGKAQLYLGIVLGVLALVTAVFTGLAYAIPTVVVWSSPCGWVAQVFLALCGGSALAATVLACGGRAAGKAGNALTACGIVGGVGAAVVVIAQGFIANDAVSSAGTTLAASIGQYWTCAVIGAVLAVAAGFAVAAYAKKDTAAKPAVAVAAFVIALVGFALIRICFYGSYLSVGLA